MKDVQRFANLHIYQRQPQMRNQHIQQRYLYRCNTKYNPWYKRVNPFNTPIDVLSWYPLPTLPHQTLLTTAFKGSILSAKHCTRLVANPRIRKLWFRVQPVRSRGKSISVLVHHEGAYYDQKGDEGLVQKIRCIYTHQCLARAARNRVSTRMVGRVLGHRQTCHLMEMNSSVICVVLSDHLKDTYIQSRLRTRSLLHSRTELQYLEGPTVLLLTLWRKYNIASWRGMRRQV